MISQTAEYALRAAVFLGERYPEFVAASDIARTTDVPASYLAKVLKLMARDGVVESRTGRGGGSRLARPPVDITTLDVVSAVDPIERIERCPLGRVDHRQQLCRLHRHLDDAALQIERAYASATIEDLIQPSATSEEVTCGVLVATDTNGTA